MHDLQTIPLVDLKAQYRLIDTDVRAAIDKVLAGMNLFLGQNVVEFEREFADYCGVQDCIGVGSGTDALFLALRALGVGSGHEVITVANTFIATVEAIYQVGATPVFVDVDPKTNLMDPDQLEARISRQTRAIIPVHLYGQVADMPRIMNVARRHGLVVVEDACQAHGATFEGQRAGSFGDAACFSFYYSKNLGAYGEAGAVVTNDAIVAKQLGILRDHGSVAKYEHSLLGVNSRLDELQAAILRIKLRHLDHWNQQRRAHAAAYRRLLADTDLLLPRDNSSSGHVYHLYVVRTRRRESLRASLSASGVATGIHYPVPIHHQPAWEAHGFAPVRLPVTEALAEQILTLPMYPELSDLQIEHVCQAIQQWQSDILVRA